MRDRVIRAMFASLVADVGGVDAVAALLAARGGVGAGCKGTVSKMISGQLGVSIEAVLAVEDCLGRYPISTWLASRIGGPGGGVAAIAELAAQVAGATGAAQALLMRALADNSDGGAILTGAEAAPVVAEFQAAQDAIARIIASTLHAGGLDRAAFDVEVVE